jgi:hypothetical protein
MAQSNARASSELILCCALRHLGTEREFLVLKARGNDFFAFPPYAKVPFGNVDCHTTWHASGERHAVSRYHDGRSWKKDARTKKESKVKLPPPAALKGVGALYHSGVLPLQFLDLLPVGSNLGHLIVFDAEGAGFRNDFIAVRVYLVEPGAEDCIPVFPDTGPRILRLDKRTTPWLAVDVYQQTAA